MAPPQARHKKPAQVADEQEECYRLQLEGLTIRQISERTGLSVTTVHRRIESKCGKVTELEPAPPSLAEQVRERHLAHLRAWIGKLDEQISQGYAVARNVEVAIRALEREAKMLGIDAPEKVDATITTVSPEDIELREIIAVEQAKAALEEQRLREEV